jgi:hypothetical protein
MVSGDEASKGHIDQFCVGGGGKQGCSTVDLCPSWYDGPLMGKGGAMLRQLFPLKLSTALHRCKDRSFTFHRPQVLQKSQFQFFWAVIQGVQWCDRQWAFKVFGASMSH